MTTQALLDALQTEGHLTDAQRIAAAELASSVREPSDPWYVSLIIGVSAWIAAILFAIFLGILDVLELDASLVPLGAVGVGLAMVLRSFVRHLFAEQLAFALSLTSQGVMLVGFVSIFDEAWSVIWLTVAVVEAMIFWIYPNLIHRLLTCLAVLAALVGLCLVQDSMTAVQVLTAGSAVLSGALWWNEAWWRTHRFVERFTALAYGVTIGTVLLLIYLATRPLPETELAIFHASFNATSAIAFPAIVWVADALVRKTLPGAQWVRGVVGGVIVLLAVITWNAPGILIMLALLLLAYARMNALLLGIGIVGFFWFLVVFYVELDLLLWVKALTMIGVGIVLLGCYSILGRPSDDSAP